MALRAQGRLAEAEEALLQAAQLPALFPVRRLALFFAIDCQGLRWTYSGQKDEPLRQRLSGHLREMNETGPVRREWGDRLVELALRTGDLSTARLLMDAWERQEPDS